MAAVAVAIWQVLPTLTQNKGSSLTLAQGTSVTENTPSSTPKNDSTSGDQPVKPTDEKTHIEKPAPEPDKTSPAPDKSSPTTDGDTNKKPMPPTPGDKDSATVTEKGSVEEEAKPEEAPGKIAPPKNDRRAVGKHLMGPVPNVLLARQAGDKSPWKRQPRESTLFSGDMLVSLPGYRSEIRLDTGVHLLLWGNLPEFSSIPVMESAVEVHVPPPSFDLDFTLETGRVIISNHKSEGPAKVRVRFYEEVWELTLLDGDSEVAMELVGLPELGYKKDSKEKNEPVASLYLIELKGKSHVKVGFETQMVREPPGAALLVWNNLRGVAGRPESMRDLPPWAGNKLPRSKAAQAMVKALDTLSERLGGKGMVDVTLSELLKEPEPLDRLAVYCLGATGDVAALLDALADEHNRNARLAVIQTLTHWLGHGTDHDQLLYQVLEKKYKSGPAEIMLSLLHGFTTEEQAQPETYETLIQYLKNDKLPIRELANWQLANLPRTAEIARKIPYDPGEGTDQRQRVYEEWKRQVPDGKLPGPPERPTSGSKKKQKQ
jgi:hypothetical protein